MACEDRLRNVGGTFSVQAYGGSFDTYEQIVSYEEAQSVTKLFM